MYKVTRNENFEKDLESIISYLIENFSRDVCTKYLDYLTEQIENLSYFPYIGFTAMIPKHPNYRALISRKNLVLYSIDETKKEVTLNAIVSADKKYSNLN